MQHKQTIFSDTTGYYPVESEPDINTEAQALDNPRPDPIRALTSNVDEQAITLNDYLDLGNHYHRKEIDLRGKEILINLIPGGTSYLGAFVSALVYIAPASEAAHGNVLKAIANVGGALVFNTFVSGYFTSLIITPAWNGLWADTPEQIQRAINNLQALEPGFNAKCKRMLKTVLRVAINTLPSVIAGLPTYLLDKQESDHPEFISDLIFAINVALIYNSVERLSDRAGPAIIAPFMNLYRRCDQEAMNNYKIANTVGAFKQSHIAALYRSKDNFLSLVQTRHTEVIAPLLALLKKDNPNREDTLRLIMGILSIPNQGNYQAPGLGKKISQIFSLVDTAAALPGYYLVTIAGLAEAFHWYMSSGDASGSAPEHITWHDADGKAWTFGSLLFSLSVVLSFDVAWDVFGALYDKAGYALHGIKKSWQESQSIKDFFKKAWENKSDLASWHNIIKLPLSVQQSPKVMIPLISFLYVLVYWSTQTSTFLNEDQLGEKAAKYLEFLTIANVMAFNGSTVMEILGSQQENYVRYFGEQEQKDLLRLQYLIQNLIQLASDTNDYKFLEMLKIIVENNQVDPLQRESFLKTFLGGDTLAIFGEEHPYSKRQLVTVVENLTQERVTELSRMQDYSRISAANSRLTFFGGQEEDRLLPANPAQNYIEMAPAGPGQLGSS